MTGVVELPFDPHPWPWTVLDRGDEWDARWGHAGWRYSLLDANSRRIVLDMFPGRTGPVPVTGTTTLEALHRHAHRLAADHGHTWPPTTKETAP